MFYCIMYFLLYLYFGSIRVFHSFEKQLCVTHWPPISQGHYGGSSTLCVLPYYRTRTLMGSKAQRNDLEYIIKMY